MKKVWVTVLEWSTLSVPQKISKAREVKTSMTSNGYFPNPDPTLVDLGNKITLLEDAKTAADTGSHEAVANMNKIADDLGVMMRNEANYVENVANSDFDNGETIILSAGMKPKKEAVRKAPAFTASGTKVPGQVKLRTPREKRSSYVWQYSTTPAASGNWITAGITTDKASIVINGLESGVRMYFRMALIVNGSQGAWSNVIDIIIL